MRRAILVTAGGLLLAGPTLLAFASGGYFAQPRLIAAIAAWALVGVAALLLPAPLPAATAGRAAVAGLVLLTLWSALSIAWAPLGGPAFEDVERLVLYVGALLAAVALLRPRALARAVEPALASGATVVMLYGLSERLVPGLVHFSRTATGSGRLDQPLTYWNAEGALAAMGLVLVTRIAGDRERPVWMRAAAAAAAAPVGLALYITLSRGALAAAAAGLVVLVAAAPAWPQLRAVGACVLVAVLAAAAGEVFSGVASLGGSLATREREGAVVLAVLVVLAALSAAATAYAAVAEASGRMRTGRFPIPRRAPALAAVLVLGAAGLFIGLAARERGAARSPAVTAGASRLRSIKSNRYAYWKVALRSFEHHPLRGVGSSGFRVEWLRERPFAEAAQDAHSLYLETAAELGLVGLACLGLTLGGAAFAARDAMRRDPGAAAGWIAAATVWVVHAGVDWDWEMPAVSLVAILLAGALIARAEPAEAPVAEPASRAAPPPRGSPVPAR